MKRKAEQVLEDNAHLFNLPVLPMDVWAKILVFNHLSLQDISYMCRANKQFKKVCDSTRFWQVLLSHDLAEEFRKLPMFTYAMKAPLKNMQALVKVNRLYVAI